MFFTYGAVEVIFPLYAREEGLAIWLMGLIMGMQLAGVIFFKPVFGRLSDRIRRIPIILAGLTVCAVSIGGIPFWHNVYVTGLFNIGFGIGFALVTSSTQPLAAEMARDEHTGASLGMLSTLMDVGQVAGPPVVGIVSTAYGYRDGFLVLAALLVIVLTIYGYSSRREFS